MKFEEKLKSIKIKIKEYEMKQFKPILCPICCKFYFSSPLKGSYEEELEEYLNGEVKCPHCGWVYDLNQAENPDSTDGYNKMSINEYKIWFTNKLKENPKYDYSEEMTNSYVPKPHKCPVCGEYEFEDMYSYDICPICGWEDDNYFKGGGANDLSLEESINIFNNKRKENPKYKWENDINRK